MTELREEAREGNAREFPPAEDPTRRGAQRANSITQPDSIALQAVTQSARIAFRFTMARIAAINRTTSLPDEQVKTLRQAWAWHRRCAAHYAAGLLRWPRQLWGAVHVTTVKPALNFAEWLTESPARCLVALAVVIVIKRRIPLPEVTWWP